MMMKLISHRGNVNGRSPDRENHPLYIKAALALGYDVEVDVWYIDGSWLLGHDKPEHEVPVSWLRIKKNKRLWCHAKNIEAAHGMLKEGGIHFFYHQTDDITLTSKNYLWTFPGKRPLTSASIAVMPENADWTEEELKGCGGICSDFIDRYKRKKNG